MSQQDTGMCLPTDGNVRWTNTGDGRDQNAPDIYRPFHIAGFGFFFKCNLAKRYSVKAMTLIDDGSSLCDIVIC